MHVETPGSLVTGLELPGLGVLLPDVDSLEVLPEHLVHVLGGEVLDEDAAVQHGADVAAGGAVGVGADPLVLQVDHGLDPDPGVGALGTGLYRTVLLGGVVQGVRVQAVLRVDVAVGPGGQVIR